jgi:hypothetical protein
MPKANPLIADPTYGMRMPHLVPPAHGRAEAHWIWLGPVVGDQQLYTRAVISLRTKPKMAKVWITGDDAFSLFINGQQVDQSQSIEQGWSHPHQDSVTQYLRAGKNVIAVKGVNSGGGAAGILLELDIDGVPTLVSGSRWEAVLAAAPPNGWLDASLDDRAWKNATDEGVVGTGVWGRNVQGWPGSSADAWYLAHTTMWPVAAEAMGNGTAQGLPSLLQHDQQALVLINPEADPAGPRQILLDFGTELSGRIEIAGAAGAMVQVHTGESRAACLRILTDPRLIAIDNSGPWTLTLAGAESQATPYTAFRYALLSFPGNEAVQITRAVCDFKYYPVKYKGSFSCSDPLLTRIWYTGAYTAHLCMQEDIWDAPKRDRGLWIGDLHVSGETINNAFADQFLMEKTIAGGRKEAQGSRPDTEMATSDINNIPGYTASWFGVLADFYRHSGDLAFLRAQHELIVSLLAYQQTEFDARNLFSNPKKAWDFCDWANGFVGNSPEALATTDLFDIYGVRQAVFLLRALGDTANADKYGAWLDKLTEAARANLADGQKEIYGDRVQENAMAVYSGVATADQQTHIYDSVLKAGTPSWKAPSGDSLSGSEVMSPFYGYYVLRAYGDLGQFQAGVDLLRRYWGAMLARGTKTWWECFDPSFAPDMAALLPKMPYLSLCHGWSSGPTSYLTECILGVRPVSGGFKDVVIQPELCDLKWAEGTVPTPHGDILLRVDKDAKGIACRVTLPAGVHAQVKLPARTVTLDHAGKYTLHG